MVVKQKKVAPLHFLLPMENLNKADKGGCTHAPMHYSHGKFNLACWVWWVGYWSLRLLHNHDPNTWLLVAACWFNLKLPFAKLKNRLFRLRQNHLLIAWKLLLYHCLKSDLQSGRNCHLYESSLNQFPDYIQILWTPLLIVLLLAFSQIVCWTGVKDVFIFGNMLHLFLGRNI